MSRTSSPLEVSMWARMSSSEKGTAVTTRFIRTTWGTGAVLPSYSARILRASSSHSSLRNGYDGIAVLLRLRRSRSSVQDLGCPAPEPSGRRNPSRLAGRLPLRDCLHHPRCRALFRHRRHPRRAGPARVHRQSAVHARPRPGVGRRRASRVEMPLLPGHGTHIEDMLDTRWDDWSAAAEAAYTELAARSDGVVVVGLSMGGTAERLAGRAPPRDRRHRRRQPAPLAARRRHASASSRR